MPITAIYARKSTESDDRQVLSIGSQVRELKDFAARQGLQIDHVFTESKSAKSPGRPVFGEVMQMVNQGRLDEVVCWKLDRLARNPVDGGSLIWAIEEGKLGKIHTPQQSFDNTGNSKFWMQLEFGMAKKYVDDLSDNVRRGQRAKLEQGWLPNRPPIGYLNDRNTGTIVPDPERYRLVRKMWELMLSENYSPQRIWEIATEKWGLRTRGTKRQGGKALARSYMYELLRQPFYYGAILRNGTLYEGAHKPMISKSDFDRVQELLAAASTPCPKVNKFAFTGLIKCGDCGGAITAERKVQRHGHRYVYYHCTKRRLRGRKCSQRVIEEKALETQIRSFLDSITLSRTIVDWMGWVLQEMYHQEIEQERAQLDSLRRKMDASSNELKELTGLRIRNQIGDEEYTEKRNELELERFRLRELLNDNHQRFSQVNDHVMKAFRFAETARMRFDKGSLDQKKAVLRYTSSNLVLLNKKVQIQPHMPFFFIQKSLDHPNVKKLVVEPLSLSELKHKTARPNRAMQELCARRESNPQPHGPKPCTLSIELRARMS